MGFGIIPFPILNYPNNLRSAYSTSRYPVDNGKSEMGPGINIINMKNKPQNQGLPQFVGGKKIQLNCYHDMGRNP
ncbi:MAG: hypothetical protein LBB21_05305 [Holosporaceae bacterium]|jgi:hypothetical protein|nr:hypothetical protein [Holosporaceae bacterium]